MSAVVRWSLLISRWVAQTIVLFGGPAILNGFAALDRWQHQHRR